MNCGTCLLYTSNGGLYVFAGREMKELIPRKAFGDSDVLAGLPYDDAVLMFTRNQGGFLYRDGRVEKWETECDEMCIRDRVYRDSQLLSASRKNTCDDKG